MSITYQDPEFLTDEEVQGLIINQLEYSFLTRVDDINTNHRLKRMYMAKDEPRPSSRINSGRLDEDISTYSNTYLPVVTGIVDTAKTLIYTNLFGSPDYLRCVSQEVTDEERTLAACRHLKHRHDQMMFLPEFVDEFLLDYLMYDFAVAMTSWKVNPGYQVMPEQVQEIIEFGDGVEFHRNRKINTMVKNPSAVRRCDTVTIPNYQCFPDPRAMRGFGDFFIVAQDVSQRHLMINRKTAKNPFGIYDFDPVEISPGRGGLFDRISNVADRRELNRRFSKANEQDVHLITAFYENYMVTMDGGGTVIRRQRMAGYPLAKASFRKLNDRFGGMGIIHVLERQQLDINRMINDRRDFNNLVLNPITIMEKDTFARGEYGDGTLHAGQLYTYDGDGKASDTIHTEQPGQAVGGDHQAEIGTQLDMMNTVSNIGPNSQAQFASGRRSAEEVGNVASGTSTALGVTSLRLERQAFEPIYDQQLMLERIHFDGFEGIRDIGDPDLYVHVTPETLAFQSNPLMKAMGMANIRLGAVDRAQLMQQVSIALSSPVIMQFTNAEELVKRFWRAAQPDTFYQLLNVSKPSDRINTPPETEHLMFAQGRYPKVKPLNDHNEHLNAHNAFKRGGGYSAWPEVFKREFDNHIAGHQAAIQASLTSEVQATKQSRLSGMSAPGSSPVAETPVGGGR